MEKNKFLKQIEEKLEGSHIPSEMYLNLSMGIMTEEIDFKRLTYPRVSDIIGRQSESDRKNIPLETMANACIRGTKVHEYCTTFIKGLWLPDIEEEYKPYVNAFIRWAEENVDQLLFSDTRLYDDDRKFTGEFDLIVTLKGSQKPVLVDIKTSAVASKSWPVQLAAYRHLCRINGYEVEGVYNIHLKKTKPAVFEQLENGEKKLITPPIVKPISIEHADLTYFWKIFSNALSCYDYFERKETK